MEGELGLQKKEVHKKEAELKKKLGLITNKFSKKKNVLVEIRNNDSENVD